jgi:catechol 2,3-dioxygenase-like lactoylglutathione lyase family enzyme
VKIERIDHLVLTVEDIERTCAFYESVLGFEVITFGPGRKALKFQSQKLNLHEKGKEFEPKALWPTPGSIDVCLITQTPLDAVIRELAEKNVVLEEGPVERTGAIGRLRSVYIRDPDRNLIEIANYVDGDSSAV